jgi:hypothetical protein
MDLTMADVENKLDMFREIINHEDTSKEQIKETMKKCVPTYKEPKEVNGE